MAGNPVRYAEDTLGVHTVFDATKTVLDGRTSHQRTLVSLLARKRELAERYLQAEALLISSERGANPELSQAAFDRHFKTTAALDDDLRDLRDQQHAVQHEIDVIEADLKAYEASLRMNVARMEELGGLLHFFAAAKQQTHTSTPPQGAAS